MNRSLLLVICDFFIVTLLTFVQFDTTTAPTPAPASETTAQVSAPAMSNMVATLATALELERQQRAALTNALALTSAELEQRLRLLAERESNLTNAQQRLASAESEARRLAEERARLDASAREASASVQSLQQAFETTRKTTDTLQKSLTDSTREAAAAKARLEIMEEELKRRREDARAMQQKLAQLDEATAAMREEKQQLALNLRTTEAEANLARREVTNLNQQLNQVVEEKTQLAQTTAQLATNVGTLAEQSTAIQQQIERTTRLPANTIYGEFLSNRVESVMVATTRNVLGQEVNRDRLGATVAFRVGNGIFGAVHIESTPLKIWPPDQPWTGFALQFRRGGARAAGTQFGLLSNDPRVVIMPLTATDAATLGVKVYEVASDPSQFAEAVVVGAEEKYYGEVQYQLSQTTGYIEMERSTFRRLLGDFSPRRGDLVFTRTGLLLGVMVNGDHCLLLNRIDTLPTFRVGSGQSAAVNSQVLRSAFSIIEKQPYPLR